MTRHELFPHQLEALTRIRGEPRVALYMEMRLGKTPVIIRWARMVPPPARILVVGPLSVLDDWVVELEREGVPLRRITKLEGTMPQRLEAAAGGSYGWYLANYEAVRILGRDLAELDWTVIICDEATALRNPQAKITKTLVTQYQHVPYRAILSGDPAPEGPMDYFSQFHFLHGSFLSFGNYWAFRAAKFKQHPGISWSWMPKPGTRDEIKKEVHTRAVVMTRKQYGIGGRRIFETRVVEQNDKQRAAIKALTKKWSFEYIETNFATVRDVWLARVAGGFSPDRENPELLSGNKTQEIIRLLQGELRKEPVVIWFRFNEELAYVLSQLKWANIQGIGITGETPASGRMPLRNAWTRGLYQVLCVQTKIGRMGWDLSHATTAIYYSNWYDWETRSQSQDRLVHPKKLNDLLYIDLITRGSIDHEVVRALRDKKISSRAFMRRMDAFVAEQFGVTTHAYPSSSRHDAAGQNEKDNQERLQKGGPQNQTRIQEKTRRVFPGTVR